MWHVLITNALFTTAITQMLVVSGPSDQNQHSYRVTATVKHGTVDFNNIDSSKSDRLRGELLRLVYCRTVSVEEREYSEMCLFLLSYFLTESGLFSWI